MTRPGRFAGLIASRSPGCARRRASRAGASGLLILRSLAFAGDPLEPAADPFDPQAHYSDGLNLFAFTAADPVNNADPLGLFLVDFGIGSAVGIDLNIDRAMDGLDVASALEGFAMMVAMRDVQLDAFANLAAAGQIDAALAFIQSAQQARRAVLIAGIVTLAAGGTHMMFAAARGARRVLQTGGRTLRESTARELNRTLGLNYHRRDWGRALEKLKRTNQLPADYHGLKIWSDGSVTDVNTGKSIDNLLSYLD